MRQPPRPDPDHAIDVRLDWSQASAAASQRRLDDHYEGDGPADDDGANVTEVAPQGVPEGGDGCDRFEAAEARIRAIDAAFGRMAEEPVSVVAEQLRRIRRAIRGQVIGSAEAAVLVDEVRRYVESRLQALRERPEIAQDKMRQGRAAFEEGLGLYLEICSLLSRLAESGEADLDALIRRLEEEAGRAMLRARDFMESARPVR